MFENAEERRVMYLAMTRARFWFDALEVGQVEVAVDGALSLRYADRWLQAAGAFPLSVTMPLCPELYPS